jgi:hypothetical protein
MLGNLSAFFEKKWIFCDFFSGRQKKSISFRDASRFRTTYRKARKEMLKIWACSGMCFSVTVAKVLISMRHKARASAAGVADYVGGRGSKVLE